MTNPINLIRSTVLLIFLTASTLAHAAPKVVVSVMPVHSLVSAVLGDVGEAQLIIPGGQSPHTSRLKPSQVSALFDADLIIWVGESLEQAMAKVVSQRDEAKVIKLLDAPEINLLSPSDDDEDEHDEHDEHNEHADHDGHGHDEFSVDPHIWLSFDNARAIVKIAARELSRLDAANRATYQANARKTLARIDETRAVIQAKLQSHAIKDAHYLVFHDAYGYFEAEFDVHPLAALKVHADRELGAKRIREIRRLINSKDVRCVFREPQFQPQVVNTLVANTNAKIGVLDPLGATLRPGATAWFELMRELADSLADCLS